MLERGCCFSGERGLGEGWNGVGWTRKSAAFGCRVFVGGSGGRETITVRMLFTVIAEVISI